MSENDPSHRSDISLNFGPDGRIAETLHIEVAAGKTSSLMQAHGDYDYVQQILGAGSLEVDGFRCALSSARGIAVPKDSSYRLIAAPHEKLTVMIFSIATG